VKCWGWNKNGQLGQGDTKNRGDLSKDEMGDTLPWLDLGNGRTALSVSAGFASTCAVLDDATLKCWGYNTNGELGQGDTSNRGDGTSEMGDKLPPVDLGVNRTAVSVSAGWYHTCAVLDDATVKCWGYNANGELGLGDDVSHGITINEMGEKLPAVELGDGRTAVSVSAGYYFTCAVLDDATVKCWGKNDNGQLGQGDTKKRGNGGEGSEMGNELAAVDLGNGRTAVSVSTGRDYACAVLDDATVKCWGHNDEGQLGLGNMEDRGDGNSAMGDELLPVDLGYGRTAVSVSAGFASTCALLDDATVKCWGRNDKGQLGLGDMEDRGDTGNEMGSNLAAVDLGSGSTAVRITSGANHQCALLVRLGWEDSGAGAWLVSGVVLLWRVGSERGWRVRGGKRRGVGVGEDGMPICG
ncbi:regulator of chromosome condensation 1/beta-lactamase-inhibitor protein II, partial [Baffinella frigidus]